MRAKGELLGGSILDEEEKEGKRQKRDRDINPSGCQMQLGWPKESQCNEGATEPLLAINDIKELGCVSVLITCKELTCIGARSPKRLVHLPTNCSHCLNEICYLLNVGPVWNKKGHTVETNQSGLLV